MLKQWDAVKEIYVACPGGFATGGTELLHQLVHTLRGQGHRAFMFYYESAEKGRPTVFDCYDAPAKAPADDPTQLLIVPEIGLHIFHRYKRVEKCVWWLSVDNFFTVYGRDEQLGLWRRWKRFRKGRSPYPWLRDRTVTHLVQSQYAADHLERLGHPSYFLSDYLRDDFLEIDETRYPPKTDKVCFNPKKGYAFTQQLLSRNVDWEWAELSNLTPEGMRDLLLSAKVYIDFGHHPGKDRIPREAALAGCVIISGQEGSAANNSDLPLDQRFKIDQHRPDAPDVVIKAIEQALNDYGAAFAQQERYRRRIRAEKAEFIGAVEELFGSATVS